jgi:hypothetical protein
MERYTCVKGCSDTAVSKFPENVNITDENRKIIRSQDKGISHAILNFCEEEKYHSFTFSLQHIRRCWQNCTKHTKYLGGCEEAMGKEFQPQEKAGHIDRT